MRIAGLLLAGGASRRFGSEKAVARLDDGLLMDGPMHALAGACDLLAVSATPSHAAAAVAAAGGYPVLADPPGVAAGPLAGILSGLRWAGAQGADYLAVAPCDAARLREGDVADLLALAAQHGCPAVAASDRGPEPLLAVWPVASGLTAVTAALRQGAHPPVQAVLAALDARIRPGVEAANVNAPEDLAALPAAPAVVDPPHARLFAFEDDFVRTLRCIPMCVRFKLDRVAVKLSLRQWSRFTLADRQALRRAPCATLAEIEIYRRELVALVAARAAEAVKPLAETPPDAWQATTTPAAVSQLARARGFGDLPSLTWQDLSELERYALVKLTRDRHENANFGPALEEFGVRSVQRESVPTAVSPRREADPAL